MEDNLTALRAERQKNRIRRAKRQRRNVIIAIIAVIVIIALCFGLIYYTKINAGRNLETASMPVETTAATESIEETEETKPQKSPETIITIAVGGDLNITDKVIASGGSNYDFTELFMDILPVISDADWTIVNLEGTIGNSPYGSSSHTAPPSLLTALRRAGVDMVQLANSYTVAQGLMGMSSTLNSTRNAGLEPLGTFIDSDEFRKTGGYTLLDVNGVRVAFVAFTKGMDGMGLPKGSENCVNLLYTDYASTYSSIDYDGIRAIMKNVRSGNPDFVVAMVHWGSEYNDVISESQYDVESLLKEEGCNAVIGTHSHYVQAMKLDSDDGSFTAYSLGDFVGDGLKSGTDYSVVLKLTIKKDNRTGNTSIMGYDYVPICGVEEGGKLKLKRMSQIINAYESEYIDRVSDEKYADLFYYQTRVVERINMLENE